MKVNTLRRSLPALVIAISITALVVLFVLIGQKVNLLRDAPADNVTWGLSQVEVDFLHLRGAVRKEGPENDLDVAELRRRFNNAYSRVSTLQSGRVFAAMRNDADFAATLSDIQSTLDQMIPLIDGPADVLGSSGKVLSSNLDRLDESARELALIGIALRVRTHSQ